MNDVYDRAILVTADGDQVPLVKAVKKHFPKKTVTLAAPPARGGEARELGFPARAEPVNRVER